MRMFDPVESLILDLLEWIAQSDRDYDDVMAAWRTSCPRFPVWEEVNDRGLVTKHQENGRCVVTITSAGLNLLKERRAVAGTGTANPDEPPNERPT
jgi:predicted transcriptional regulator